jgi:thiosulfate/3-mercaptopyruvate sulfurtransferase
VDDAALPPFVSPAWLAARLDDVTIADVRWSLDGREDRHTYEAAHLPGAVFVDLARDLARPGIAADGRHPLPTPEVFAERLGALGIGDEEVVVATDHGPGAVAARLAWMLRAIGQPAAVLDGGVAAWHGPLEAGPVVRRPVGRRPRPWPPELVADTTTVAADRADPTHLHIDARDAARYRGDHEPIDPRAGHVPGAVNVPASGNLGPDGLLLDDAALRARYGAAGAFDAATVTVSCGSGVTATHDLLVLEHLGVVGRLYPGSWSAWSADPARPVATGDDQDGSAC